MGSRRSERASRIYVGNLPQDSRRQDVEDLFQRYGRIVTCDFKRTVSGMPFAFVEFEDERDAEDAIKGRDGYNLDGQRLRVEIPFSRRGGPSRKPGIASSGPPQRGDYRVLISGLPRSGSWQDLKDHMRDAGPCVYADVFGDGTGVMEYTSREHMESAIRYFDGSKFRSHEGEVARIEVRQGGSSGGYRNGRDRSRSPGYDRDYDRRRDRSVSRDRRRYGSYSRSRSRSLGRRY